jgi:hypothetical protein
MKKHMLVSCLLFAFVSTTSCEGETSVLSCLDNEYTREFALGFTAGAAAGLSVEFFRNYILPDLSKWRLYGNYGICRDQLEGEAKVAVALLLSAAYAKSCGDTNFKKLAARLCGVMCGACAYSVTKKTLSKVA